jgi:type VI secretion system protein ImpH
MAGARGQSRAAVNPLSPLARLLARPQSFRFDAAIRVLLRARRTADPAEAMRFRSIPNFSFPPADITEVKQQDGKPPRVVTPVMGLTGPTGVLPRYYTETVAQTLRNRSRALHDFIDTLAHRFVGGFARAGTKYRPHLSADQVQLDPGAPDKISDGLLALTGYGTPNLVERLAVGPEPLLHYAGLFALRPRSADRLAALVSDWVGRQVEVVQFAGTWLFVPPDQRSRLGVGIAPGAFSQLGIDAAIGVRAWDPQGRIILRIGPLTGEEFDALLPDRPALRRLVSLVRAYVGFEIGFAINPVLARMEVPPLRLDASAASPPRLGWNTWMPTASASMQAGGDAAEAMFEAELVEAQGI